MTNKQRSKIYRKAAELLSLGGGNGLCCCAINDTCNNDYRFLSTIQLCGIFPELGLFNPHNNMFWWPLGDLEPRIIALLLAAEIAERP